MKELSQLPTCFMNPELAIWLFQGKNKTKQKKLWQYKQEKHRQVATIYLTFLKVTHFFLFNFYNKDE